MLTIESMAPGTFAASSADAGIGLPVRKSGAMAMKPSAASWSATERIHGERPKISWMTTTTGAFVLRSGYTTQARTLSPPSTGIMTYSPWRGEAASRAAAAFPSGGRVLSVNAVDAVVAVAIAAVGVAESWPAWTSSTEALRFAQADTETRATSAGRSE